MTDVPIRFIESVLKFKNGEYIDGRLYRRDLQAGDACWGKDVTDGIAALHFVCPCGCQMVQAVTVKRGVGSGDYWDWDGNQDKPTLTPSILSNKASGGCGWHGHLTAGVFKPC